MSSCTLYFSVGKSLRVELKQEYTSTLESKEFIDLCSTMGQENIRKLGTSLFNMKHCSAITLQKGFGGDGFDDDHRYRRTVIATDSGNFSFIVSKENNLKAKDGIETIYSGVQIRNVRIDGDNKVLFVAENAFLGITEE